MVVLPYNFTALEIIEEGRTSQRAVDEIKQWLATVDDLPSFQDELVVLFLLSCDNDIEATQTTIRAYFKHKKNAPEMFNDRDMDSDELQKTMRTINAISIPTRTDENYVIHFFKIQDTNYSNLNIVPAMKAAYMLLDISQNRHPPAGLIVVMDMQGVGLLHLTRLKLGAMKKFFQFLQEGMALQIKAIHILNTSYVFDRIMDLIRVFIKSDLLKMMHTHTSKMDMEEFYEKHVPAKCLPKEYGGELPSCGELNQKTVERFRELKEFFDAEERLRLAR